MLKILSTLFLFFSFVVLGQVGGETTYQFLDLDYTARSVGLGGDFMAVRDNDINLTVSNPANIEESMNNQLALNHFFYPGGINYGSLIFGKKFEKIGMYTGHLRYVNYGRFTRTDVNGVEQGNFTAGEYALGFGYGKKLNKFFALGINLNAIFAHYESYSSFGIGGDVAFQFHSDEQNFSANLVARNIGYQIKGFTKANHEALPLELLLGLSYKFQHAPFRLSMILTDLTEWDISYNDPTWVPTIDPLTQDTIPTPEASNVQKVFYHTNFGVEILPNENLSLRLGFNYQNRDALGVPGRKILTGFSAGFGFNTSKFNFNYGLAFRSAAGVTNVFGITTKFDAWVKRN